MIKRLSTILAGAAALTAIAVSGAVAEQPESPGNSVAAQQCAAEKQSVKNKTFKQIYGKHAMKTCLSANAEDGEQAAENAALQCKAELDEFGEEAFVAEYGTNENGQNAFGKCVSQKAQAQAEEDAEETANAAKECKAERDEIGADAFAEQYGTNSNKKNAFGKCVSEKAQEADEETPATA